MAPSQSSCPAATPALWGFWAKYRYLMFGFFTFNLPPAIIRLSAVIPLRHICLTW
ncbi:hypothetical protein F4811DRAFT_555349 [Daldinia bambusicola]|nr:hypothetical protein F4811DRAFT_555349 [Daldinia bambusicola]